MRTLYLFSYLVVCGHGRWEAVTPQQDASRFDPGYVEFAVLSLGVQGCPVTD